MVVAACFVLLGNRKGLYKGRIISTASTQLEQTGAQTMTWYRLILPALRECPALYAHQTEELASMGRVKEGISVWQLAKR